MDLNFAENRNNFKKLYRDKLLKKQDIKSFKVSLKRKIDEDQIEKNLIVESRICFKKLKKEVKDESINEICIDEKRNQFIYKKDLHHKTRAAKKKVLKNLIKKRKPKLFTNTNNLSIFDINSVYKYKFEQQINKILNKINSFPSIESNSNNDKYLDLNHLFQFNNDNLDEKLAASLKQSFIGKGSFGKVFKVRLNKKIFAIKIGLSNSFYGCSNEQNALYLNDHPNVIKTFHILKLKLTNDGETFKHNEEFPLVMNTNISYHTMKHIIDLNLIKLIDLFPKHKLGSTLNVIIMELAGDVSLQQLIDDTLNQKITKKRRIHFAKQICDALVYLKTKSIAHLDLKPANIMISKRDDFLKLIDFGCSKKCFYQNDYKNEFYFCDTDDNDFDYNKNFNSKFPVYNKENFSKNKKNNFNKLFTFENSIMNLIKSSKNLVGQNNCNIGTIPYTAPEIFNRSVKNFFQADVYSLAIILWQLVTRETPYSDDNIHSIIYRVASGKLRPKFDSLFFLEEKNYYDLTTNCWNNLPEKRPTIEWVFKFLNTKF